MQKKPAKVRRRPGRPRRVPGAAAASVERHYLDREQAAAYLGCSVKYVRKLVRLGQLVEINYGQAMKRYTRADLDAYAAARRTRCEKQEEIRRRKERNARLRQRMGAATWDELVGT